MSFFRIEIPAKILKQDLFINVINHSFSFFHTYTHIEEKLPTATVEKFDYFINKNRIIRNCSIDNFSLSLLKALNT